MVHEPPVGLAPWTVVQSRQWWSAASDPELPAITTRRAYTEVLFVFGAFFLAGVVAAGLSLAGHYKDVFSTGSWAEYGTAAVDIVAQIGLAVAVVLLLSQRRGVSPAALGLRLPRDRSGRFAAGQFTRALAWAVLALIVGGILNAALQTGHLPIANPNAPELMFAVFDSVQAGIIEELVVLGFLVVTLRQAGRPWGEVTVVALVLRGSYHIYYGPGVLGIVVWAALFYWLYLRFRTLVPLMLSHAVWDSVGFLSQRWGAVVVFALLVVAVLWIAAPITWLVERSREKTPAYAVGPMRPGMPAPPGWHPDPSGVNRWRWWDGYRWTEHVSSHTA